MSTQENIIEQLKTVYDPEFPMVDIYTLGLIYDVIANDQEKTVKIIMTFTTPSCPLADTIKELIHNAAQNAAPEYEIEIEVTFDPMRNQQMIKDEDLKRMFA